MELIDRKAPRQRFENYRRDCEEAEDTVAAQVFADCICELDDAPTVDAEPVVHARWIYTDYPMCGQDECSVCGSNVAWRTLYCPHCGAKMDGETNK